jgi:transposase
VTLVGCWTHCRRYFFEAAICKHQIGVQGLMRIRAMYAVDDTFRSKRNLARDEHLRPMFERFFEWVGETRLVTPGRSLATKALGYASNQKEELMRVLDDGRLPLDNTRSEPMRPASSWSHRDRSGRSELQWETSRRQGFERASRATSTTPSWA